MSTHLTFMHKQLSTELRPPVASERTVVFTDVVDSTALVDVMGDEALLDVMIHHHELALRVTRQLRCDSVASTGDGVYAVFAETEDALVFARTMITGMHEAAATGVCAAIRLHVGIASGPVHRWSGDYFGRTMHMAARICRAARPNEILLDSLSVESLPSPAACLCRSREVELRGFSATETIHQIDATSAFVNERSLATA